MKTENFKQKKGRKKKNSDEIWWIGSFSQKSAVSENPQDDAGKMPPAPRQYM